MIILYITLQILIVNIVKIYSKKDIKWLIDGSLYYFMDNETFDQITLNEVQINDVKDFLVENTQTTILLSRKKIELTNQ